MCDEIRRFFFSEKTRLSGKEKNASKHRAGNNNNTLESKSNEIPHTNAQEYYDERSRRQAERFILSKPPRGEREGKEQSE